MSCEHTLRVRKDRSRNPTPQSFSSPSRPDLERVPKPFSSSAFGFKCRNASLASLFCELQLRAVSVSVGFFGLSFSSNLFSPSLSLLFEIPSRRAVIHLVSSLFLQAFLCVCFISWTLSSWLKLETCRGRPDARIS